jgi:hypothetical protein
MLDVFIAGGGPAGMNAALILGRVGWKVLLADDGQPRNASSAAVHGFLSRDGADPAEIRRAGRAELARYPSIQARDTTVQAAAPAEGGFEVTLADGTAAQTRRLLLATGVTDPLPDLPGLAGLTVPPPSSRPPVQVVCAVRVRHRRSSSASWPIWSLVPGRVQLSCPTQSSLGLLARLDQGPLRSGRWTSARSKQVSIHASWDRSSPARPLSRNTLPWVSRARAGSAWSGLSALQPPRARPAGPEASGRLQTDRPRGKQFRWL